jgi:ribosomal protein S18 acetylase RimI-like enzyme
MTLAPDVRRLTRAEIDSAAFLRLLRLAAELEDEELRRIRDEELPAFDVFGIVVDGEVVGFSASRVETDRVALEYIATSPERRGAGLGAQLVAATRLTSPGRPLLAQTDDDAVGFYRALGFTATPAPADPRWPERQRYDCVLPPDLVAR